MPRTKDHAARRWQEEVESEQRTMHRGSTSNPETTEPCIRQTGFKIFYSELVHGLEESAIYNEIKGEMASVAQLAGQMWKDLDHDEKLRYNTRAQQQRQLHREMMPPTEKKAYTPPVFRTKCSPRMVLKLKEDIISQPHKVQLIKSMGFESMLYMSCKTLRLTFVAYVLDRFDPDTLFLQVGVNRVHITAEDVGKFLGIPFVGKSVPSVISIKKMNLLKARFPNRSFAELNRLTVHGQESDEVFMQTYLLYLLGCFLCPTTLDQASPTLLNAISIASKANEYNWGSYVLKWLVQQVKGYKEKQNPGGTGGCLFFLMIFYLHHAGFGDVGADGDRAIILGWTDELIEKSINRVMQTGPSTQSAQRFQNPMLYAAFQQMTESLYQQFLALDQSMQHSGPMPSSSRHEASSSRHEASSSSSMPTSSRPEPASNSEDTRVQGYEAYSIPTQRPEPSSSSPMPASSRPEPTSVYSRRPRTRFSVQAGGSHVHDAYPEASNVAPTYPSPLHVEAEERIPNILHDPPVGHPFISDPAGSSSMIIQRRRRRPTHPGKQLQSPYESAAVVVTQQLTPEESLIYNWCMKKYSKKQSSEMLLHIPPADPLTREEIVQSMSSRGNVSLRVMDTARVVIMDRDSNQGWTRQRQLCRYLHIFHPDFGVEFERMFDNEFSKSLARFEQYFLPSVLEYNIKDSNMLMIPLLRDNHWWCCVFNLRDSRVDVLDSIHSFFESNNLEAFVMELRELVHSMLTACGSTKLVNNFEIKHHKMPQQALRDPGSSGIFVIKFMEIWDGRITSSISKEMINAIRRQLVVQWIRHPKNNLSTQLTQFLVDMVTKQKVQN